VGGGLARRRAGGLSTRSGILLCIISGILLSLCFPPAGLWPLAWVALVPWIVSLRLGSTFAAVAGSWLGGAAFFALLLYWLNLFGMSVWWLVAGIEALTLAAWGVLARWTGRLSPAPRAVAAAALWVVVEWFRGQGRFGFGWGWLGYSQSPALSVLPVARALGTLGLSFVIVLVNAAIAEVVVGRVGGESAWRALGRTVAIGACAALIVVGARLWASRLPGPSGPTVRVAVVQGSTTGPLSASQVNEPLTREEQTHAMDTYARLTLEAAKNRPAITVWPESAVPGAPEDDPWVAARLSDIAQRANSWLVVGGPYQGKEGGLYNSAYLYSPTGNLVAHYEKVHLVPFGEYVPGRAWLPFLDRYHVRTSDFAAGSVHRLLQAGTIALGPMICFESTFPEISYGLVRRGAQALVIITNDAWFGRTAAAAQHRQIAVLRAAETGRWVLRGASTGISSIISPEGRIVAEAGLYKPAVLSAEITLPKPGDRLAGWGIAFPWAALGLAVAFVIAPGALPGRRQANRGSRPGFPPRRRGR